MVDELVFITKVMVAEKDVIIENFLLLLVEALNENLDNKMILNNINIK